MSQTSSERFRRLLEAARTRDGMSGVDTMIVSSHLAQMRMFMLRQGIEFYPRQDTNGLRKMFLAQLIEENEIDARLEGIVDDFLCDGKGLFFFRPVGDSYRIMWFPKDSYRAYYDAAGQIDEVDVTYSFMSREASLSSFRQPGTAGNEQWVRLKVRRDTIVESISPERPSFDDGPGMGVQTMLKSRTLRNSLGFVPAIEAFNAMRSTGMDSTGDFDWLAEHILVHDDLVKDIRRNLRYFGTPTLVSSRPRHDLVEGDSEEVIRPTISSQAGFYAAGRPAPAGPGGGGLGVKVPRMIANIEPTDRVAYITPDAISGDQNTYARQYREEIRVALGGVDELGISTGATAYEIKSLYGRAATTALRKCRGLLTYGLCKLLALMIYHEERIFRESFAQAIGLKEPVAPMREDFEDTETYEAAQQKHEDSWGKWMGKVNQAIQEAVENREIPSGVVGLIPDGDRRIEWRWRGPVFEDSTQDILNNSIVVRNLQELGVNSIEALRYLFPDKTDEERSAMLNGYPFRMAQATQQSIGTFLSLIADMRQIPHPQAPDLPLLADARLDLTPYLYRALDYLKRELTYAGQYADASGASDPTELNPLERARLAGGYPVDLSRDREPFTGDDAGPGGAPMAGAPGGIDPQSLAGGVPTPGLRYERDAALPAPGALLGYDPTGTTGPGSAGMGGTSSQLPGAAASGQLPGAPFRFGSGDLAAASNPGVSLTPDLGAELGSILGEQRGTRRVPQRRQRRKS